MNLSEAAQQLGVPGNTLSQWLKRGLVSPPGWCCRQRVPVPLGAKELRELSIIAHLRRAGVSLQAIKRAADLLRRLGTNPFSRGSFLVVDRGEVLRMVGEQEAIALLRQPGQLVLALPEDPAAGN